MMLIAGIKLGVIKTAIAFIRLFPEQSWPYTRLYRGYHQLSFIYRHKRMPGAAQNGFNDFLFARKVNGTLRQPLKRQVSDKELGKHYIASHIGDGRTIATLAVLRNPAEVASFEVTVFPVVIKPTHSSGKICVVRNRQDYLKALPMLHGWLKHDYFAQTLEENYAGLQRKIILEPYLDDDLFLEGSIHCRNGQARIISVIDRFDAEKRRASYDRHWQSLHVALGQPYKALDLPPPPFLAELLAQTETIAADFDFVRVDFYASKVHFLFGELTNLPGGALARFSSKDGETRFNQAFFG